MGSKGTRWYRAAREDDFCAWCAVALDGPLALDQVMVGDEPAVLFDSLLALVFCDEACSDRGRESAGLATGGTSAAAAWGVQAPERAWGSELGSCSPELDALVACAAFVGWLLLWVTP